MSVLGGIPHARGIQGVRHSYDENYAHYACGFSYGYWTLNRQIEQSDAQNVAYLQKMYQNHRHRQINLRSQSESLNGGYSAVLCVA